MAPAIVFKLVELDFLASPKEVHLQTVCLHFNEVKEGSEFRQFWHFKTKMSDEGAKQDIHCNLASHNLSLSEIIFIQKQAKIRNTTVTEAGRITFWSSELWSVLSIGKQGNLVVLCLKIEQRIVVSLVCPCLVRRLKIVLPQMLLCS